MISTFFQIRKIKEPLAVLQEINQNTVGQISPVDVISYIEALSVSSPLLTIVNNTISDNEMLYNLTLNVSESSRAADLIYFCRVGSTYKI